MNKIIVLLILVLIVIIPNVFAECSEGQIDINSASVKELEKLSGIGPVKANAIISGRSFGTLDDLIDVYGIGEATLKNIKTQGLACVVNEEKPKDKEIESEYLNESETLDKVESEDNVSNTKTDSEENKELKKITNEVILLTPKDIKTSGNVEGSNKTKYISYAFVVFCVLLIVLFGLKKFKEYGKNEFD